MVFCFLPDVLSIFILPVLQEIPISCLHRICTGPLGLGKRDWPAGPFFHTGRASGGVPRRFLWGGRSRTGPGAIPEGRQPAAPTGARQRPCPRSLLSKRTPPAPFRLELRPGHKKTCGVPKGTPQPLSLVPPGQKEGTRTCSTPALEVVDIHTTSSLPLPSSRVKDSSSSSVMVPCWVIYSLYSS